MPLGLRLLVSFLGPCSCRKSWESSIVVQRCFGYQSISKFRDTVDHLYHRVCKAHEVCVGHLSRSPRFIGVTLLLCCWRPTLLRSICLSRFHFTSLERNSSFFTMSDLSNLNVGLLNGVGLNSAFFTAFIPSFAVVGDGWISRTASVSLFVSLTCHHSFSNLRSASRSCVLHGKFDLRLLDGRSNIVFCLPLR